MGSAPMRAHPLALLSCSLSTLFCDKLVALALQGSHVCMPPKRKVEEDGAHPLAQLSTCRAAPSWARPVPGALLRAEWRGVYPAHEEGMTRAAFRHSFAMGPSFACARSPRIACLSATKEKGGSVDVSPKVQWILLTILEVSLEVSKG